MFIANEDLDLEDFLNAVGFIAPTGFVLDLDSVDPITSPIDSEHTPIDYSAVKDDSKAFTRQGTPNKMESNEQDASFFREPMKMPAPTRANWYTPIETGVNQKDCPFIQVRDWDDMKTYEITEGRYKGTRFSYILEERLR